MKFKIPLHIKQIETGNYHVFVEISIDNKPCRLLLDTGASKTVFDALQVLHFANHAHIKKHHTQSVGLGTTGMDTKVVALKNVCFGKLKRKQLQVAVLDLSHVNQIYSSLKLPQIHGVLGSDVLHRYKAIIRYDTKELFLQRRN